MFCKFCGKEINDNAYVCVNCGQIVKSQPDQPTQSTQSKPSSAAKVLAILGFIFSFLFAIAGLVLSIVALNKYKNQEDQSCKGLAVAGLTISIIFISIVVIYLFFALTILNTFAGALYDATNELAVLAF